VKPVAFTDAIAAAISEALGTTFKATALAPVGGGCIHSAMRIDGVAAGASRTFFAKADDPGHAAMFAAEADGLQALRAAGAVAVPATVASGGDGERAWIVLEWLDLVPLDAAAAAALGEALAAQHRVPQARYGWPRDNFIGATPQANGESDDWLAFWREKRLMAQLRIAARNRLPSRIVDRGERLAADCEAFFRGHVPPKSLLHGDLWSGNASAVEGAGPVAFDPAAYVGDREADLAMTELFGGFPPAFHAAYRAAWPLADGYRVRRGFYNLYHLLNHANLFSGEYVARSAQAIEQLLAEIG
jgi:protein-ribulosamine 3-kinase